MGVLFYQDAEARRRVPPLKPRRVDVPEGLRHENQVRRWELLPAPHDVDNAQPPDARGTPRDP
jgi:hypothetical protein